MTLVSQKMEPITWDVELGHSKTFFEYRWRTAELCQEEEDVVMGF
jgi:hypothetical protein